RSRVDWVVEQDVRDSNDVLLVVDYSSLDRLLSALETRTVDQGQVRLLLARSPSRPSASPSERPSTFTRRSATTRLGISVLLSGAGLHALELVRTKTVRVRTYPGPRRLHAKIYATEKAITLGSS